MSKLYEISNDYAKLMSEDLDPEMIADTLEGMEGEFSDKVESIIKLMKDEQVLADALKAEANSHNERANAINNRIDRMKQYMIQCMQTMEKTSINAGTQKLTVRKGRPVVQIDDADSIPVDYIQFKTTQAPDKNLILEKLKLGETIEGVSLATSKPSLSIK